MYYDKEIIKRDYNEKYNYTKINLLNSCFNARIQKGKDDSAVFQSIFNIGLVTTNDFNDNKKKSKPYYGFSINPVYANIIDTIVRKTIVNDMVEKTIIDYLSFQYKIAPDFISERIKKGKLDLREEIKEYKDKDCDHYLFLRYVYTIIKYEITKQGNPILNSDEYEDIERKVALVDIVTTSHNNIDISQPSIFDTLSEFLDYDFDEKPKLIYRYVKKRTDELYNYILKKAGLSKLKCSDEEKNITIIATATGLTASVNAAAADRVQEMLDKKLLNEELFRPANQDDKIAEMMTISRLGVLNRLGINAKTGIISNALSPKFGDIALVNSWLTLASLNFKSKYNESIVGNAILEDLLDKVSDAYFSKDKEPIKAEQIVRTFEYNDTDCKIVFEKIASIMYCNILSVINYNNVASQIEDANYKDISFYLPSGVKKAKQSKDTNKDFAKKNAEEETKRMQEELDAAYKKIETLNLKINDYRKENLELSKNNSKQNNKNSIISELKEQIKTLETENNQLKEINSKLISSNQSEETSNNTECEITTHEEDLNNFEIDDELFKDMRVIIVGGRFEINRKLASLMPKAKFTEKGTDKAQDVRKYDGVIMFTDFMSHLLQEKYISSCRYYNVPVLYLRGTNFDLIKQEIYKFQNKK